MNSVLIRRSQDKAWIEAQEYPRVISRAVPFLGGRSYAFVKREKEGRYEGGRLLDRNMNTVYDENFKIKISYESLDKLLEAGWMVD